MARLVVVTCTQRPTQEVLPALLLLGHDVDSMVFGQYTSSSDCADMVVVDATVDVMAAKDEALRLGRDADNPPVIAVFTEGAVLAAGRDWHITDFVVTGATPAELSARVTRALVTDPEGDAEDDKQVIALGELSIFEESYTVTFRGQPVDLTFKEFELLKCLAQSPGRVFRRDELLDRVWGYEYFGGTRTVDVHVRRLRAKLGPEAEHLIGTVRGVGYRARLG